LQDPSHLLPYAGEHSLPPPFPDSHSYPHAHSFGHQPTSSAPIAYAPERGAPLDDRGDHRVYDREPWTDVGGHQPEEVYGSGRDFGNLSRELVHSLALCFRSSMSSHRYFIYSPVPSVLLGALQ
jgi:hypothetical protein